jgi:serine/threonine protein kinase
MANLIGKEFGNYRITDRIGSGGMAEVYRGIHTHLDRPVAIKVLHSHLLTSGDFIERFKREAKAVANLRHPNIVQVHDFDIQEEVIFMVMEYIDGANLHDLLIEYAKEGKHLTAKQIGSIINDIASALDYAHTRGMLHRDIKPSNIMLDKDGKAYLTDFGLAKILGDHHFTATGTLLGTPAYMSPEQGKGEDLTEQSDLYSLGIVAFEMLTGKLPYEAQSPIGIVHKQISEPVPVIGEYLQGAPISAQDVIDKALAKSPESRFTSADELVQALRFTLEALESSDVIQMKAPEVKPDDEIMTTPTVEMQDEESPVDLYQPTVAMEEEPPETKPEKEEDAQEKADEPAKPEKPKTKKGVPAWAWIVGVVGLLVIAGGLAITVFDLDFSDDSTAMESQPSAANSGGSEGEQEQPDEEDAQPPSQLPEPVAAVLDGANFEFYDGFDSLTERWYLYDQTIFSDGMVTTTAQGKWGPYWMSDYELTEGMASLLLFKFNSNADFTLGHQIGDFGTPDYFFRGINEDTNRFDMRGGTPDYTDLTGNLTLAPDIWYYGLFAIGDDGEYLIRVWEKDNPASWAENKYEYGTDWADRGWWLTLSVGDGSVSIDDFYSFSFSEIK